MLTLIGPLANQADFCVSGEKWLFRVFIGNCVSRSENIRVLDTCGAGIQIPEMEGHAIRPGMGTGILLWGPDPVSANH